MWERQLDREIPQLLTLICSLYYYVVLLQQWGSANVVMWYGSSFSELGLNISIKDQVWWEVWLGRHIC